MSGGGLTAPNTFMIRKFLLILVVSAVPAFGAGTYQLRYRQSTDPIAGGTTSVEIWSGTAWIPMTLDTTFGPDWWTDGPDNPNFSCMTTLFLRHNGDDNLIYALPGFDPTVEYQNTSFTPDPHIYVKFQNVTFLQRGLNYGQAEYTVTSTTTPVVTASSLIDESCPPDPPDLSGVSDDLFLQYATAVGTWANVALLATIIFIFALRSGKSA